MLGPPIGEHRANLAYGPKITERDAYYCMSEVESASRKARSAPMQNPDLFRRHAAELAPEVEVRVLDLGGTLHLDAIAGDDRG
jgi:hypothetical protein